MKTKLKDNKVFRCIVIPICVGLCLFGRFIPPFGGLSSNAMGVLFIFLGSLILWLTIGIDWPSLLCIFSLGMLNVTQQVGDKTTAVLTFKTVFQNSFGNETFVFLLFTFVCTYALSKTSLIRRIAISFINSKLAKKSGFAFITLFLLSVLLVGMFISPSVLFVIILPVLEEVFKLAGIEKQDKVAKVLMMGLGFTVSISSGMTPIAHVFPVMAIEAAAKIDPSITFSYLSYMGFAIPVGIITFALMLLMFRFIIKPDTSKLKNADVSSLKKELPKIDSKDIAVLSIFAIVVLLWIIPSFFKTSNPVFYNAINKYGTAMPPILGTLLLCIIRVKDKPLLSIGDAFKNGVPWTSLLMCAATLVLGVALTNDYIGIKSVLQSSLQGSLAGKSGIFLLIVFAVWAALQTNVSSNMVTATLVATVAASIIFGSGSTLNLCAVASVIGLLASYAFATPPSMPHIAIVAGSDYCSTKDVLIFGSILMVISIIISLCVGYPLASVLM